jgi:spermidine/putrescine-binding protein
MKKVHGYAELYKDDTNGVIINKASSDRERYRIAKENALKSVNQDSEIKRLSDEISEIKSLLHQLTKAIT